LPNLLKCYWGEARRFSVKALRARREAALVPKALKIFQHTVRRKEYISILSGHAYLLNKTFLINMLNYLNINK